MALNVGSPLGAYRNYQSNTNSVNNSTKKLSSGYRINGAGDDAAGLAISEKMRAQITAQQAQYRNTQDEISFSKTGDGALSTVHDSLNRMRELASQASNGTYGESERAMLQQEFSQLQEEVGRVYEGTSFNGTDVLSGAPDLSAFSIATQDGAAKAVDGLSDVINSVSAQRGDFGAQQNRAEHTAGNLINAMVNAQDAESEIRDLDIALAVMENTKKKILSQSSIAMLAQANQRTASVMSLLNG
ncbi:MAG: flagellin [Oscillospiraceae bacterium]|nr:flagellin [Oscillospiraceae bacterium]